ncbi:uncharacterized protein LOC129724243 [Wyeomyia smithii]|uniref:uncharacterized protein LOC129724243 n=1 Tax=Wyeomyia smithii TaxID=174621 RepID=UPI0024681E22|nr:uncharacterized protein LOC129724243 [Wyeomyia smithii]
MLRKTLVLFISSILIGVCAANVCVENGMENGFLPHPTNCSLYYSCYNGIAYEVSCPAGYYFNPTEVKCDASYVCLVNNCPSTGIHRLPVEGVCEQYILCVGGEAFLRECGEGLRFNSTAGMCIDGVESGCINNECDKTQGHPQGFVDPFNCAVYYICDEFFEPVQFQCPEDTIFDAGLLDCVKGSCEADATTTTAGTTTTAAADTTTEGATTLTEAAGTTTEAETTTTESSTTSTVE